MTELVPKVHLLTVCGHSPLCILGAQKQFSLTAPDFDLRELPYFSRFSKWVELWKRVRFSPFVCLAVGYSLVTKRQSFCKESFVFCHRCKPLLVNILHTTRGGLRRRCRNPPQGSWCHGTTWFQQFLVLRILPYQGSRSIR